MGSKSLLFLLICRRLPKLLLLMMFQKLTSCLHISLTQPGLLLYQLEPAQHHQQQWQLAGTVRGNYRQYMNQIQGRKVRSSIIHLTTPRLLRTNLLQLLHPSN